MENEVVTSIKDLEYVSKKLELYKSDMAKAERADEDDRRAIRTCAEGRAKVRAQQHEKAAIAAATFNALKEVDRRLVSPDSTLPCLDEDCPIKIPHGKGRFYATDVDPSILQESRLQSSGQGLIMSISSFFNNTIPPSELIDIYFRMNEGKASDEEVSKIRKYSMKHNYSPVVSEVPTPVLRNKNLVVVHGDVIDLQGKKIQGSAVQATSSGQVKRPKSIKSSKGKVKEETHSKSQQEKNVRSELERRTAASRAKTSKAQQEKVSRRPHGEQTTGSRDKAPKEQQEKAATPQQGKTTTESDLTNSKGRPERNITSSHGKNPVGLQEKISTKPQERSKSGSQRIADITGKSESSPSPPAPHRSRSRHVEVTAPAKEKSRRIHFERPKAARQLPEGNELLALQLDIQESIIYNIAEAALDSESDKTDSKPAQFLCCRLKKSTSSSSPNSSTKSIDCTKTVASKGSSESAGHSLRSTKTIGSKKTISSKSSSKSAGHTLRNLRRELETHAQAVRMLEAMVNDKDNHGSVSVVDSSGRKVDPDSKMEILEALVIIARRSLREIIFDYPDSVGEYIPSGVMVKEEDVEIVCDDYLSTYDFMKDVYPHMRIADIIASFDRIGDRARTSKVF